MRLIKSLLLASGMLLSGNAFALIEGQLLVGQRTAAYGDNNDFSGTETKLSVYVDPIPLIPVGAGISYAMVDLGDDDLIKNMKGNEISVDVTAWIPLGIAGFKPYAKLGYVVSGEYTYDQVLGSLPVSSVSGDAKGTKFSIGVKYSPLPLVGFMAELEKSDIEVETDNFSRDSDNTSFFIGVAAGI